MSAPARTSELASLSSVTEWINSPPLNEDVRIGENTNNAIIRYQQMVLGSARPDGRIVDWAWSPKWD